MSDVKVSAVSGDLLINGALIVFGRGWIDATPNNLTAAQCRPWNGQTSRQWLINPASGYAAITVDREGGDVDVYTIGRSGRDVHYVTTVTWYGHKVQR